MSLYKKQTYIHTYIHTNKKFSRKKSQTLFADNNIILCFTFSVKAYLLEMIKRVNLPTQRQRKSSKKMKEFNAESEKEKVFFLGENKRDILLLWYVAIVLYLFIYIYLYRCASIAHRWSAVEQKYTIGCLWCELLSQWAN
jgi:hypothetical protein